MSEPISIDVVFEELESKAAEFVGLSLVYCEEVLRQDRLRCPSKTKTRGVALAAASLSVQESIKVFLAVARIKSE